VHHATKYSLGTHLWKLVALVWSKCLLQWPYLLILKCHCSPALLVTHDYWEKIMFTCEKFWGDSCSSWSTRILHGANQVPVSELHRQIYLDKDTFGKFLQRATCTVAAIIQNASCWCFWSRNVCDELGASGAHLDIRRLREGGVPIATIVWTKFVL